MDRIAVLVPCYNEEKTVGKVVRDMKAALPEAVVYVYNNNSKDRTVEEATAAGAVVRNEFRQGKGNVIRRMFREIDAECYILIDGDDTYPAESAAEMARLVLEEQADMVVGDRLSSTYFSENKRPFHNFGNSIVKLLINQIFRSDIMDIMTGYRAFSYGFVKTFPVLSEGFEIETEMTIHAIDKNMGVRNVIIDYRDRPEGSDSKLNTFSDGIKVIGTIFRLCRVYRPMLFFGMISLLLALLSLIFIAPVMYDYAVTGQVARFPTLIVCGFTFLAALLSLFAGLILGCIVQKNRQDHELELHRCADRFSELKKIERLHR